MNWFQKIKTAQYDDDQAVKLVDGVRQTGGQADLNETVNVIRADQMLWQRCCEYVSALLNDVNLVGQDRTTIFSLSGQLQCPDMSMQPGVDPNMMGNQPGPAQVEKPMDMPTVEIE